MIIILISGKTPLFLLLDQGGANPAILRELLKAGADPNIATWNTQQSALHVAARRGYQVCMPKFTYEFL